MSVATVPPHLPGGGKHGSDEHQHHPHLVHGCSPSRQFGASGNSHGYGACGLHPLAGVPSLRAPQDPVWPNRDRFVLSAGHASMLLYSLLHLTEVPRGQQGLRNSR